MLILRRLKTQFFFLPHVSSAVGVQHDFGLPLVQLNDDASICFGGTLALLGTFLFPRTYHGKVAVKCQLRQVYNLIYMYMYVYMYICIYVYVYVYIYIYI